MRLLPGGYSREFLARRLANEHGNWRGSSNSPSHQEALTEEPRSDQAHAPVRDFSSMRTSSCGRSRRIQVHNCRASRRQSSHAAQGRDASRHSHRPDRVPSSNRRSSCRRRLGQQGTRLAHAEAIGGHTPADKSHRLQVATWRHRIYLPPCPCGNMSLLAATSLCCRYHVRRRPGE